MINEQQLNTSLNNLPSGEIKYGFTNDYMFKAVMQKNKHVLEGLLYTLLSLPKGSIAQLEIVNPIVLGEAIGDKTCILDIKVVLNNNKIINIEMQVNKSDYWPERSLTYLCRTFNHLKSGNGYELIMPSIHIGILDFEADNLPKSLYSEYKLLNTKTHEIYSDKFILYVLNLKAIGDTSSNPNESPENEEIYRWAKLFKAKSWEEVKMIAAKNEYMSGAVLTLRDLTDDEKIQMQCEARFRYECDMATSRFEGLEEGKKIGLDEGKKIGLDEGKKIGLDEGKKIGLDEGNNRGTITTLQDLGHSKSEAKEYLISKKGMTASDADKAIASYWVE